LQTPLYFALKKQPNPINHAFARCYRDYVHYYDHYQCHNTKKCISINLVYWY